MRREISLTTYVDRAKIAEETGPASWDCKIETRCVFEQFESFGRVALLQSRKCSEHGQVGVPHECIFGMTYFEVKLQRLRSRKISRQRQGESRTPLYIAAI
jgi:hypothetical protein